MRKRQQNREAQPAVAPAKQLVRRPLFELPAAPTPPAISEPIPSRRRINPNAIRNFDELQQSLAAEKVQLTLAADIIATANIVINYDVTINLNGHSIISEESQIGARVIDVRRGEINLIGQGKIFAMGPDGVAVRAFGAISAGVPRYTTITIENGIHLYAPEGSGILIAPNLGAAYGVRIDFGGEIIARSGICLGQAVRGREGNRPLIRVRSGANIIADETHGAAIEAAGIGRWHIEACNLYGQNGLRALAGQFDFLHTQVAAASNALEFSGDTPMRVAIDYGTFVSETGLAILGDPSSIREFVIRDGHFHGAFGAFNRELASVIHAERTEFDNQPADFLPKNTVPESLVAPEPTPEPAPEPTSEPAPTPVEPAIVTEPDDSPDERAILEDALRQALDAMKNLSSADYVSGFRHFKRTVQNTEQLLGNSHASLAEIRDAASNLLAALDQLDSSDNLSLTDAELDQLFYQGAVLQEATETFENSPDSQPDPAATAEPSTHSADTADTFVDDSLEFEEVAEYEELASALSDLRPSDADLAYAPMGQAAIGLAKEYAQREHASNLDELTPATHWTTGTTAIDEQTPYSYQEYLATLPERRAISGFVRWARNLRASFHAGIDAFRDASQHPRY